MSMAELKNPNVIHPSYFAAKESGGGGNMNDKDFVTHTELELSNEKLLRHMDEHFNQLEQ